MRRVTNSTCRKLIGALSTAGLLLALPAAAAPQNPVLLDRVVAVVNNAVITDHELQARVDQVTRQLSRQNTQAPPRQVLEKQLLERMITERALLQLAEQTNIRADSSQIDRTIARIAQQNGMDVADFRTALEHSGMDWAGYRDQVRNEILIGRLREREVDSRIGITDAEIDNYLANPASEAKQKDEYRLAHILVSTPEGASPERLQALKAKAERALADLKAGADFAQVSAAYSDAQNALEGGELGWRAQGQLPDLFAGALQGLQAGQTSVILRSANGFHILKLLDRRGKDSALIIKQTHARHILIKTNEVVTDQDARNRLLQLKERIDNGQGFAELAKLHSDDLSASKGGDLGWLNPGDTVPDFERAMDALQPGQTSEPVRSPFGWHLVQVLERRDQDVTQERRRFEARQAIRNRKSDEAFESWVRQVRDSTYVEYRLEEQ